MSEFADDVTLNGTGTRRIGRPGLAGGEAAPVKRPVVIMGLTATGLAPLRALGAMGVPCLGMWRDARHEIGRHSRYLDRSIQVASSADHEQVLSALDELTEPWRESSPILFPASDVYAAFIDEMQDELRLRYTIRCSARRLHATFVDKAKTIDICTDLGIPIPRSVAIESIQTLSSVCGDFRFPVIVKPRHTHGIDFPGKNFVASSALELSRFSDEHAHLAGQTVVQEVIRSGDGRIVAAISYSGADGVVLAQATIRKIRQWHPDFGITSHGRSELVPEVAALSERFLNEIGYQGFAGVEFAEDAETGRYSLLEVNPRLFLPVQLVQDADVDLIGTAYREMSRGECPTRSLPQTNGVHWLDFRYDVFSFLQHRREGRVTFVGWLRSLARSSSYAVFDVRDPVPFLDSSLALTRDLVAMLRGWLAARVRRRVVRGRSSKRIEA